MREVVLHNDIPRPKDLFREKLGQAAIGLPLRTGTANQIMNIAMNDKQTGRTREIKLCQSPSPIRIPIGQLGRTTGENRWRQSVRVEFFGHFQSIHLMRKGVGHNAFRTIV